MGSTTARLMAILVAAATGCRGREASPPSTLTAAGTEMRRTIVRRTPRPPAIDGALWQQAPALAGFVDVESGLPSAAGPQVRLLWDQRNLYALVAARAGETVTMMVHGAAIGSGGIDVEVGEQGARTAHRPDSGAPRALHVVSRVARAGGRWTAEVSVPMTDLALLACARAPVPPSPGDVWGLNIVRRGPPPLAWSRRVAGDLHRLDQLGELVFVDEGGEDPETAEGREGREADDEDEGGR
jgi:hypothetical protein